GVTFDGLVSSMSAAEVLYSLKDQLSYTVRFETQKNSRTAHSDLLSTNVVLVGEIFTVRDVLLKVSQALGNEWQITALPGHIIIYKESATYVEGEIIR
ncbi:MAG: hypothetical protein ACN6OP_22880, partial [Pseudomonadales bacterium]